MENIEQSEQNVALEVNGVAVDVDVIAKDAELELNNNESVKSFAESIKQEILVEEPEKSVDQVANDAGEINVEPKKESSTDTNNGDDEKSVDNNSVEGDSKVDDASESSNAKTEQSDASTNETSGAEATDETPNSENSAENVAENKSDSSEQSNDGETKTDENNGTSSASANETSDDAEQSGDATATSKDASRSQKKGFDYSKYVNYALVVSQRQRRYFLQVARGAPVPIPADDCEIFVSNVPINVLEPEIIPLFERFGKIFELRLMMSMRNPKRNAGFAFVRFTTNESAKEATEKLNNYEIVPGKHLAVRLSQPNLSLFVGNIHRGLTREQIHEKIAKKTAGLVKTFVKSSLYEDTKNCGFCFLEYNCHSAALKAKRKLNSGNTWGRQLFVDWAQRRKQFDESTLQESKTLFINYLPKETTDQQITDALSSFGNIEKVTKIKDYAFVLFAEHQAAMNAMESVDKSKFGNDSVEVSLAMPKTTKTRSRAPSFAYRHPRQSRRSSHPGRRSHSGRRSTSYNRYRSSFDNNKFYLRKHGDANHTPNANNANNSEDERTNDAAATTAVNTPVDTVIEQTIIPSIIVSTPEQQPQPVN